MMKEIFKKRIEKEEVFFNQQNNPKYQSIDRSITQTLSSNTHNSGKKLTFIIKVIFKKAQQTNTHNLHYL